MNSLKSNFIYVLCGFPITLLTILTFQEYPGQWWSYLLFTLTLNGLLFFGFSKNKIFFDTFIGVFLWLGFWLKFSVRTALLGGHFWDPVGTFDYSPAAYDKGLLAASVGIIGLLAARVLRSKFIFNYSSAIVPQEFSSLTKFYQQNRKAVWAFFVIIVFIFSYTNATLGVYQRGRIPSTLLPFPFGGIYTWLLFFGFASVSAVMLNIELKTSNNPYLVGGLALVESFLTNVSMLSRGYILNSSALIWGSLANYKKRASSPSLAFKCYVIVLFVALFGASVVAANYVRVNLNYFGNAGLDSMSAVSNTANNSVIMTSVKTNSIALFIDRWVGLEGMLAISHHPHLGWDLFKAACQEKFSNSGTSFFDLEILVDSSYKDMDLTKYHAMSLPGIVAFFYYPGSLPFLFFALLCVGILAGFLEKVIYIFSGANLILCSLLAQVIAYRFVHFGYAPRQSYLLFGSILLTVFCIYGANRLLELRAQKDDLKS